MYLHWPEAPPALGPRTCWPAAMMSGFTRPYPPGSSQVVIPARQQPTERHRREHAGIGYCDVIIENTMSLS